MFILPLSFFFREKKLIYGYWHANWHAKWQKSCKKGVNLKSWWSNYGGYKMTDSISVNWDNQQDVSNLSFREKLQTLKFDPYFRVTQFFLIFHLNVKKKNFHLLFNSFISSNKAQEPELVMKWARKCWWSKLNNSN